MTVVVPTDLDVFTGELDVELIDKIRAAIANDGIHLSLPRFDLGLHTSLIEPLQELGLTAPFGPDADFSGMTGEPGLSVDAV